ncbi:SAV_2336 N-terminal domain-related protein [Kitasatospora sp. NPDC048239]|uniref:SAV_2336 N-terminal domain-related protein n=1 Tax=Kitasatospora sp. NPDC048239 TaxID=3364046 RepID=UPI003714A186
MSTAPMSPQPISPQPVPPPPTSPVPRSAGPVPAPVPGELLYQLGRLLTADGTEPEGSTDPRDLADVLWLARVCGLRPDTGPEPPGLLHPGLPALPTIDAEEDERAAAAWGAALRAAVDRAAQEQDRAGTPGAGARPPVPDHPDRPGPAAAAGGPTPPGQRPDAGPPGVVPLHLPPVPDAPGHRDRPAASVRSPARPALTGTLALSRALRPLRRSVRSVHERVLDEAATVAVSGRAGLVLPVWQGAPERWLDVDLVVDCGPTMAVWSSLADELTALLRRHGAFQRVRAWSLHERYGVPVLTPRHHGAPAAATRSAIRRSARPGLGLTADPRGRRILLVLTDGVGPLWQGAALPAAMHDWSRHAPVTVLQVLPRRHWHRTALHPVPARARVRPGERPTVLFTADDPWTEPAAGAPSGRSAPGTAWAGVVELRADWLAPWSRMLSGRAADWTPVLAVPLDGRPAGPGGGSPFGPPPSAARPRPGGESPAELLARFRREASPTAYELAGFLAASPLSLPVMRHVQQAMLAESSAAHLAELYLSGLLERRSPEQPGEDPESVLYDFRPGIRSRLLSTLTRGESAEVLHVLAGVSQSVAGTFGTLDFRALAALAEAAPAGAQALPAHSVPFAEVAVEVLRGLGGADGALADRLAVSLPSGGLTGLQPDQEARPARRRPFRGGLTPGTAVAAGVVAGAGIGVARRWWQRRGGAATPAAETAERPEPQTEPTWNNLPPDRPDMTGREGELLEVERILHPRGSASAARSADYPTRERSLCVVQGPPGVGKTSLALAHAHLYRESYSLVWWVDGRSHTRILRAFTELADVFSLTDGEPDGLPDDEPEADTADGGRGAAAALNRRLTEHPGWLIVIDGLGDEMGEQERWLAGYSPRTLVGEHWPPDGYGSVLVTTRINSADRRALEGHVLPLTPVRDWSGPDGPAVPGADPGDHLAALPDLLARASGSTAVRDDGPAASDARSEPAVSYDALLDRLSDRDGRAMEMLSICAFLAPQGLSLELIAQGLRAAADEPGTGAARPDGRPLTDVLGRLSTARLLHIAPNSRTGSIAIRNHEQLQRAVRARMSPAQRRGWARAALQAVLACFPPDPTSPQLWVTCTALLPHAHTVVQREDDHPDSTARRSQLLHRLARFRARQGDLGAAQAYLTYQESLRTRAGLAGADEVDSMLLLAEVLRACARYGPAERQVRKALAELSGQSAGPATTLLTVRAHRLAAALCRDLADPAGSLRELRAARQALGRLGRTKRSPRELTPSTMAVDRKAAQIEVAIHRELALTELEGGRLGAAADHLERAWTELLRLGSQLSWMSPVLEVSIRQDRARLSLLQGRPSVVACDLLAQSVRQAGADHEDHDADSLDLIMGASEILVDTIREYFEQLKTPQDGLPGTYHPLRARQLASAAAIVEAVLAYRRGRAELQPHRLAAALDVSGMLLAARGQREEALQTLAEAAELHERVHGRDHPAWADNRWRLGRVLAAAGDRDRAHALFLEARAVLVARLGADHPRLVPVEAALRGFAPGPDHGIG